jgi:hypothetical protein
LCEPTWIGLLEKPLVLLKNFPMNGSFVSLQMAQRKTYLIKAYSIPPKLLVNTNQIKIHFVPTRGIRNSIKKGL